MTGQQLIDAVELNGFGHAYVRCRDPKWADPNDYLRLSVLITQGNKRSIGPWAHLFARRTQEIIGEKTPQVMFTFQKPFDIATFLTEELEQWTGELDPADK